MPLPNTFNPERLQNIETSEVQNVDNNIEQKKNAILEQNTKKDSNDVAELDKLEKKLTTITKDLELTKKKINEITTGNKTEYGNTLPLIASNIEKLEKSNKDLKKLTKEDTKLTKEETTTKIQLETEEGDVKRQKEEKNNENNQLSKIQQDLKQQNNEESQKEKEKRQEKQNSQEPILGAGKVYQDKIDSMREKESKLSENMIKNQIESTSLINKNLLQQAEEGLDKKKKENNDITDQLNKNKNKINDTIGEQKQQIGEAGKIKVNSQEQMEQQNQKVKMETVKYNNKLNEKKTIEDAIKITERNNVFNSGKSSYDRQIFNSSNQENYNDEKLTNNPNIKQNDNNHKIFDVANANIIHNPISTGKMENHKLNHQQSP